MPSTRSSSADSALGAGQDYNRLRDVRPAPNVEFGAPSGAPSSAAGPGPCVAVHVGEVASGSPSGVGESIESPSTAAMGRPSFEIRRGIF
jgi:hypothetical protein